MGREPPSPAGSLRTRLRTLRSTGCALHFFILSNRCCPQGGESAVRVRYSCLLLLCFGWFQKPISPAVRAHDPLLYFVAHFGAMPFNRPCAGPGTHTVLHPGAYTSPV